MKEGTKKIGFIAIFYLIAISLKYYIITQIKAKSDTCELVHLFLSITRYRGVNHQQ
jgi:hypothetical protein